MTGPAERGQLLIVSAPSGAGKTSLIQALVASDDRIEVSVSHTTRPIRPGEVDGENYFFVSEEAFLAKRERGGFFESATVFGNLYGTGVDQLEERLARGVDVVLEIDWQGARQVQKRVPDSIWIFILPPSVEALRERLDSRGQDASETIEARMLAARDEMSHWQDADYLIVNEHFDQALEALRAIVASHRLSVARQRGMLTPLINRLLKA